MASNFTYGAGNPLNIAVDPYNSLADVGFDLAAKRAATALQPQSPTGPTGSGPTGPTGSTGATGAATGATGSAKTVVNSKQNEDGTFTILYSDGTVATVGQPQLSAKQATERQNAIAALTSTFAAYGLTGDIANAITTMVQQGYTADTISLVAQDPNSTNPLAVAMQTRFAGNSARVKAGMAPLSPAEYIATERSYRQILSSAGLPKGFYDDNSDFTKFISKDISPTELKSRVDLAADAVTNADPFYRQSLQQQYGLSTGDMIAHVLDPAAALPLLQKQAAAVSLGAEAQRQGLAINNATAMLYGAQGISQAQAQQGFKAMAEMLPEQQSLAWRFTPAAAGEQGAALMADIFNGPNAGIAAANNKLLATQETSLFSGSAGASSQGQSLGTANIQGAI